MIYERISDDIPPQVKILNTFIPHSNAILHLCLKLERYKPHKAARHSTKCDVINDVKLFPTVYRRIYCSKCFTLSNQRSRYKSKCIRIMILGAFLRYLGEAFIRTLYCYSILCICA